MRTTYFTVHRVRGPQWNPALPMREQRGWAEHAAFMEGLAGDGVIILGGLLGEGEQGVLLVFDAPSEEAVKARLNEDPWNETIWRNAEISAWTILLDARLEQGCAR